MVIQFQDWNKQLSWPDQAKVKKEVNACIFLTVSSEVNATKPMITIDKG